MRVFFFLLLLFLNKALIYCLVVPSVCIENSETFVIFFSYSPLRAAFMLNNTPNPIDLGCGCVVIEWPCISNIILIGFRVTVVVTTWSKTAVSHADIRPKVPGHIASQPLSSALCSGKVSTLRLPAMTFAPSFLPISLNYSVSLRSII